MAPETEHRIDEIMLARRRRRVRILVAVVVLVLAGLLLVTQRDRLTQGTRPPKPMPPSASPAPTRAPEPPAPPTPAPRPPPPAPTPPAQASEPEPPLPQLDESDEVFREHVSALSTRLELGAWLDGTNLLRRFVTGVANVAEGDSPRKQIPELAPEASFRVVEDEGVVHTDPQSYERYDTLTQVFLSIDEEAAVATLNFFGPLLDEAYRDLGHPEADFDRVLRRALVELLRAPVVTDEPALERQVVTWAYVDPELEGLSPAQKQLLRTGPINVARIQRKLRSFALAFGLPEAEIPPPRFHDPEPGASEEGP